MLGEELDNYFLHLRPKFYLGRKLCIRNLVSGKKSASQSA